MLKPAMNLQQFRHDRLGTLTDEVGVYALCDLDEIPIYIGQSTDGIRKRVRRHLTSARSDVIANRQIDVWEVAFVWAWPIGHTELIREAESRLFHEYNDHSALMNGSVPVQIESTFNLPAHQSLQIMPDDEIDRRRQPRYRFPRQAQQVSVLLDYIIETSDKKHLRRSLHAHFSRLETYYKGFQAELLGELGEH